MSKILTLHILLVLDIIWFLCFPKPILLPLFSTLPDQEIVFTAMDQYSRPTSIISFINLDGINFKSHSLLIPSPIMLSDFPIKYYEKFIGRIYTWSLDGDSIGIISPVIHNGQGYPIIVDKNGQTHFCPVKKSIIAQDAILIISPTEVMAIEKMLGSDGERLVTYDMKQCKITKINYLPNDNEDLVGFSYTKTNWLAIEIGSTRAWDSRYNDFEGIRVFDPDLKMVLERRHAYSPALTPDGKRIAFTHYTGSVCVTDTDNYKPVCAGNASLKLSWSPDGKWLVYSNDHAEIIKQEVSTGKETVIAKGRFPDWRP
jgi:hypothetical protein